MLGYVGFNFSRKNVFQKLHSLVFRICCRKLRPIISILLSPTLEDIENRIESTFIIENIGHGS